jgi:riboflavin synthase
MFTGLVETLGIVRRIEPAGAGRRLGLEAPSIAAALSVGESVAVNGVCLTVIAYDAQSCTVPTWAS